MKQLIEYIVSNLVNHPEDVIVEEQSDGNDLTLINIQVNPEDIGRVIGKSGKVIKAIRQITRIAAIQKGIRVRVDLIDQNAPAPQTEAGLETPEVEPINKEETSETEPVETKPETLEAEPVNKEETSETEPVETKPETPKVEPVKEEETGKQVYPEPETLEAESEKKTK